MSLPVDMTGGRVVTLGMIICCYWFICLVTELSFPFFSSEGRM
jgi:hypothetical protein